MTKLSTTEHVSDRKRTAVAVLVKCTSTLQTGGLGLWFDLEACGIAAEILLIRCLWYSAPHTKANPIAPPTAGGHEHE